MYVHLATSYVMSHTNAYRYRARHVQSVKMDTAAVLPTMSVTVIMALQDAYTAMTLMSVKTTILVTILMVLYVTTLSEAMSVLVHLATPSAMSHMNASLMEHVLSVVTMNTAAAPQTMTVSAMMGSQARVDLVKTLMSVRSMTVPIQEVVCATTLLEATSVFVRLVTSAAHLSAYWR